MVDLSSIWFDFWKNKTFFLSSIKSCILIWLILFQPCMVWEKLNMNVCFLFFNKNFILVYTKISFGFLCDVFWYIKIFHVLCDRGLSTLLKEKKKTFSTKSRHRLKYWGDFCNSPLIFIYFSLKQINWKSTAFFVSKKD